MNSVHVCSFSGSVAELTVRQKKDSMIVLRVLSNDPMVSTWDMGEGGLWKTIKRLEDTGLIASVKQPYPWHKFVVTEAGKAEMLRMMEARG